MVIIARAVIFIPRDGKYMDLVYSYKMAHGPLPACRFVPRCNGQMYVAMRVRLSCGWCLLAPAGLTPEQLTKMASNPEIMVLLQNPKMQEIMKKVILASAVLGTLNEGKLDLSSPGRT